MNPYIPHNPLQGSYVTPHGPLKLAIFIAKMWPKHQFVLRCFLQNIEVNRRAILSAHRVIIWLLFLAPLAPTTSPVETPIVLVPVYHFKASQTIRNEHVETFTINQERRGKGNTQGYFSKICMLKQLGITCTRCGSCGAHRTANCKKSKEELECSDCKSRGRPYIGHVNKTCFDRLGLPRTRKK